VQFVKKIVEKLLTVLMIIASELRVLRDDPQHPTRLKSPSICSVERLDKFSIGAGQVPLAAQNIAHVEVFQMFVGQEIARKTFHSKHTLQS
jgi:hypothetical protein